MLCVGFWTRPEQLRHEPGEKKKATCSLSPRRRTSCATNRPLTGGKDSASAALASSRLAPRRRARGRRRAVGQCGVAAIPYAATATVQRHFRSHIMVAHPIVRMCRPGRCRIGGRPTRSQGAHGNPVSGGRGLEHPTPCEQLQRDSLLGRLQGIGLQPAQHWSSRARRCACGSVISPRRSEAAAACAAPLEAGSADRGVWP